MKETVGGLERRIEFRRAYDTRNGPGGKPDGSLHNMEMTFYVVGPKGAVEWEVSTSWFLRASRGPVRDMHREFEEQYGHPMSSAPGAPWGTNLGYHAREPQYEGQGHSTDECPLLGVPCYRDGSTTRATLPVEGFLAGGEDWLWSKLEAEYRFRFEGEGEWPFKAEAEDARAHGEFV